MKEGRKIKKGRKERTISWKGIKEGRKDIKEGRKEGKKEER